MRRIALVLATTGVIAFGIASIPAQAHDFWGYSQQQWHQNQWRGHEWREHEPHVTILRGSRLYN